MTNLEESRKRIDIIDEKIMELFEQRMEEVALVALYKKENNMEIFQEEREKQVIEKNVNRVKDENIKKYAKLFLENMMNVSKMYQEERIK